MQPQLEELRRPPVPGKETAEETLYQRILRELGHGRYIDVTKETQFSEAWLMLAILLTGAGLLLRLGFLLSAALVLFVVAGVTWAWNELSLFGLHYERRLSETRAFLGETIELTLVVRNQKFFPLTWLDVVDRAPAGLLIDGVRVSIDPLSTRGEFHTFWAVAIW
jgi:hypothetical protein